MAIAALEQRQRDLATWRTRLLAGLVKGDCSEVHLVVAFLQDHVLDHFGMEERWMAEVGYPELDGHKAEHDVFMREYVRHSVEVEKKGATPLVAMRVANWLGAWLRGHVAEADAALGRFLEQEAQGPLEPVLAGSGGQP
jgi:hemerythrin